MEKILFYLFVILLNYDNIVYCKPQINSDSSSIDNTITESPSNSNYAINPVGGYGHPKHNIRYNQEQLDLPNEYLVNSNTPSVENKQQHHQPAININGQHENQDQNLINNQQQYNNEQNYYNKDIDEIKNIDNNYLPYNTYKNENTPSSFSDHNVNYNYAIEQKMYEEYVKELIQCMERHKYNLWNNIMAYRQKYQQQLDEQYNQQYSRRNSPRFLQPQEYQPKYMYNTRNNYNEPAKGYEENLNREFSVSTNYQQNNKPYYYNGFNMVPNNEKSFVQQRYNPNNFDEYGY